jgi:sortase A
MKARILSCVEGVLLACGLLAFGYCAFVMVQSRVFQRQQNQELDQLIQSRAIPAIHRLPQGALVGRIEVKRLGLSVAVVEGTDEALLAKAAGHIEGTSLPGEDGNVAIAAHRDTFFRPLRNIRKNDIIGVTTPNGAYRYRVVEVGVVTPDTVSVLTSSGGQVLTLVTCYPFTFIGSAPDRFIVRAEEVETPVQPEASLAHPRL